MANQLGNIVAPSTIRQWLIQQDGFCVRKDRVLPSLDDQAKYLRVVWAHSFWVFWLSAKCVNTQKALFVLVHMDKKWFYAVRTRSNCKVLTSIGLEPTEYCAHHKNHVEKEMYIVVTAYVLRDRNDSTKGGTAIPVSLVRVGSMVKAVKDSYKRVYREDGTYHYPKIESNILRKKGEYYFRGCKLTGSNEGTERNPKMSLLRVYENTIIPDLEEKIVRRFNNYGTRKVVIVKQEDGAGLHQDQTYMKEMQKLFNERGWVLFRQPSQSPVTNVHDSCVFPMMSKAVSTIKAIVFGSRLLKGEQLHQTVQAVWNDEKNHVAMSRAFAGHHQIVLSIMHHNGDNAYLSERGGLSFGIRKSFVVDDQGRGVVPVQMAPTSEGETTQGSYLNKLSANRLKFPLPELKDLDKFRLDKRKITVLDNLMDRSLMSYEMKVLWDNMIADMETESEIDEYEATDNDLDTENEDGDVEVTVSILDEDTSSVSSQIEATEFIMEGTNLDEDGGTISEGSGRMGND